MEGLQLSPYLLLVFIREVIGHGGGGVLVDLDQLLAIDVDVGYLRRQAQDLDKLSDRVLEIVEAFASVLALLG